MRGLNQMVVVGNLGDDVVLKQSSGGRPWTMLSVATGRSRREGDAWVEETDWHRVKVFGADAERCQKFLRKGSLVGVEGSVVYERWTDGEGIKRSRAVIVADRVQFLTQSAKTAPEQAASA